MNADSAAEPSREELIALVAAQAGDLARIPMLLALPEPAGAPPPSGLLPALQKQSGVAFDQVQNGETGDWKEAGTWLFEHRYRLAPDIAPERFTAEGLRNAIVDTLSLLGTAAGIWQRERIWIWYCAERLVRSSDEGRAAWGDKLSAIGEPALPTLLTILQHDDPGVCATAKGSLVSVAGTWTKDDPRRVAFAKRFFDAEPRFSTLEIERINKCQRFEKKLLGLLNVTHCKNVFANIFRLSEKLQF